MTTKNTISTAEALLRTLESPNEVDSNFENANVVDVLAHLARATDRIATAITPADASGEDAAGGRITSLTEASMGHTAALLRIAEAIVYLADTIDRHSAESNNSPRKDVV